MKPYYSIKNESRQIATRNSAELEKDNADVSKLLLSRSTSSLIGLLSPLLLLASLAACSAQSSTQLVAKQLKTVQSWTATAHTVGDAWMRGDVPPAYAKQTLKKAKEELRKQTDKLEKNSGATNTGMQEKLKHIENTVGRMSVAVEKKDRTAMSQYIRELATQEQRISTLAKIASGEQ